MQVTSVLLRSARVYDKISREDILAHAYAQCRSNKGAPGVDGQDFADIDAYGVERFRRLRRKGFDKAAIRVRQIHEKIEAPDHLAGDIGIRLCSPAPEGMRRMVQRRR